MAGTMEEVEIVEGNEEIGGRKRVNDDEDARPAKRAQSEGNEATVTGGDKAEGEGVVEVEEELKEKVDRLRGLLELNPEKLRNKHVQDVIRNLDVDRLIRLCRGGRKRENDNEDARPAKRAQLEGDRATGCWNLGIGGDKAEGEGEEEQKEKVDRLRGLLEDNPKKLSNKDVEDVIRYLDVDEITSLALKSEQQNGSEQCWVAEVEKWTEDKGDSEKVIDAVRSMLCRIEGVKRADLRLLYEKLSPKAFAKLLLAAEDANSIRQLRRDTPLVKAEEHDVIPKLCCVLPWKLFAHILCQKFRLPLVSIETDDEEEEEEECTPVQKEAAKNCDICFGKGRQRGSFGSCCTFKEAIPKGTTSVGTDYWRTCSNCGFSEFRNSFEGRVDCDWDDASST